ncbi:MAG TPA: class I SAM-dependent methyltransferase [Ktedonobacteraceae bacterium]|nr:class I SAM-dependent methyltransferase [Ktedonobacteraceae bacterium]
MKETTSKASSLDWKGWLERWDHQQAGYLPTREARFQVMLDALEILVPSPFVALDLACGPGSLSQRLLTRFPQARCLAIDVDPVLLTLGRQALGDLDGRLTWIEHDLRDPEWNRSLGVSQVDAVLTTTALHWLRPESLVSLYTRLATLIRPGGLFLNGDHLAFPPSQPGLQKLAQQIGQRQEESIAQRGGENWTQWWAALEQEPELKEQFARREQLLHWQDHGETVQTVDLHKAALSNAGFREVDICWQELDNRVLLAIR